MDNSLLVSLSQQLAAYRSMDVIANNLANVSTPGFKREAAKFEEYVAQVRPAEGQKGPQIAQLREGRRRGARSEPGRIEHDRRAASIRHQRQGLFHGPDAGRRCATPATAISRSTPNGQLVTSDGDAVQGDGGAITITPDDGDIHIAQRRHHQRQRQRQQLGKLQRGRFRQ